MEIQLIDTPHKAKHLDGFANEAPTVLSNNEGMRRDQKRVFSAPYDDGRQLDFDTKPEPSTYSVQKQGKFCKQRLFSVGGSREFESERLSLEKVMFATLCRSLTCHSREHWLLRKITCFHSCKNTI